MPQHRLLSWSAAIRDICADRTTYAPGERSARYRQNTFTKLAFERARTSSATTPLVEGDQYSRRAIMTLGIAAAKARRVVTGEPWTICLSAALRGTWQAAKAERSAPHARMSYVGEHVPEFRSLPKEHRSDAMTGQRPPAPPEHSPPSQPADLSTLLGVRAQHLSVRLLAEPPAQS